MPDTPITRALRWARDIDLNQSALAERIGVRPQDITNWKSRGMPPEHHAAVAQAVGHSVDELLGLRPTQEISAFDGPSIQEPRGRYATAPSRHDVLDDIEQVLRDIAPARRDALAALLAGWARDGGRGNWRSLLAGLIEADAAPDGREQTAASARVGNDMAA